MQKVSGAKYRMCYASSLPWAAKVNSTFSGRSNRAVLRNQGMEGEERVRKNTHCPLFREELLSAAMSKKTAEVTALLPPCPAGSLTCLEAASKTTGKAGFVSNTAGWRHYTQNDKMLLSSQVMMGQFIFIGMSREGEPVWPTLQQQDTVKGNFTHTPHSVITHLLVHFIRSLHTPCPGTKPFNRDLCLQKMKQASTVRIFSLPYS